MPNVRRPYTAAVGTATITFATWHGWLRARERWPKLRVEEGRCHGHERGAQWLVIE